MLLHIGLHVRIEIFSQYNGIAPSIMKWALDSLQGANPSMLHKIPSFKSTMFIYTAPLGTIHWIIFTNGGVYTHNNLKVIFLATIFALCLPFQAFIAVVLCQILTKG